MKSRLILLWRSVLVAILLMLAGSGSIYAVPYGSGSYNGGTYNSTTDPGNPGDDPSTPTPQPTPQPTTSSKTKSTTSKAQPVASSESADNTVLTPSQPATTTDTAQLSEPGDKATFQAPSERTLPWIWIIGLFSLLIIGLLIWLIIRRKGRPGNPEIY